MSCMSYEDRREIEIAHARIDELQKQNSRLENVVYDLLKLLKAQPQTQANNLHYRTADRYFAACVQDIQESWAFCADESALGILRKLLNLTRRPAVWLTPSRIVLSASSS